MEEERERACVEKGSGAGDAEGCSLKAGSIQRPLLVHWGWARKGRVWEGAHVRNFSLCFQNTIYTFSNHAGIIQIFYSHINFIAHFRAQQGAILKEKEEEEKQRLKALRNAEAIRQQVKERELSAIAKRRETFKDADQLSEEARLRRLQLSEIKEKKLKELRWVWQSIFEFHITFALNWHALGITAM